MAVDPMVAFRAAGARGGRRTDARVGPPSRNATHDDVRGPYDGDRAIGRDTGASAGLRWEHHGPYDSGSGRVGRDTTAHPRAASPVPSPGRAGPAVGDS